MARMRRNRRKSAKLVLPRLPSLPRPAVDWQALFAAAAVIALIAVSVALGRELLELPVKKLSIEGSFQRVTKLEILAAADPALDQSLLALDLGAIRQRVAAIDWIDTVTLQRVWPDTLKIAFAEHRAAARWGASGLLNTRGELFADDVRRDYRELPKLAGPAGSHGRVAATYLEIRERLSRANLILESIEMDARGAYSLELGGGLSIRIGREDIPGRIERFFDAVDWLEAELARVAYIDLRYPKGFAVGWRDQEDIDSVLGGLANRG